MVYSRVAMSVQLYGCSTWTLTKHAEKKLDENYTKMQRTVLNKSWRQHPIKKLYGHISPISQTIQARQIRHIVHGWENKAELISDILLCTTSAGRPAKATLFRTQGVDLTIYQEL